MNLDQHAFQLCSLPPIRILTTLRTSVTSSVLGLLQVDPEVTFIPLLCGECLMLGAFLLALQHAVGSADGERLLAPD